MASPPCARAIRNTSLTMPARGPSEAGRLANEPPPGCSRNCIMGEHFGRKAHHMAGEAGQELKFDLTDLYVAAPAFTRAGGAIGDAVSRATSQLEGLGT